MRLKDLFKDIHNWEDFESSIESLNKKQKGDAFEMLTKLYFKLSPKYSFYDEVWMLTDVPNSVLDELGIPSHDLGIDLIAKTGKEYHAIQCKYHSDKNQSVTFKEVSTFISLLESNKKFTQGYICSTADLTSRNYNKLNTKPINLILSDSWQELGKDFFENARQFLSKKKVSLVSFKPRDHQKKALSDAVEYFRQEYNTRGKLIFPCGAGKSLTGFWMIQELKSKSTLIAVPSLSLVKQTLDVYLREIVAQKRKIKWLCICSDEGIGQGDDVVFYTENLGVPCQTDPDYIEQWLKTNKKEEIIVFTTYQSGRLIADISKKLDYSFDLGIFDEAHKTVGSDKKLFSYLLFEENITIAKRIFMTATERFYRGTKDDIISMDNYEIYGDTFTQMSFKEAIDLGLLTDYKVITIDVKKSEIAEFIKENNLVQLNEKWGKETEARSLASMLALRKAMKKFPIKNAVSFHSSIDKAIRNKELQNYITDTYHYDPIESYTVSGKLPTSKRNVIVQEFARSPKSLITNARCLTEGVDVPNIDCIVFSDPRKSKVDIVQALGRALRKKEGKDWGYVVLPVIYDEETQEIDNENFEEILSIVRGLASNDERIVEYFKEKNDPKGSKKKSTGQFHLEMFSEYLDEAELSNQLEIRLWEKLSNFIWLPLEDAKNEIQRMGIKTIHEWQRACKKGIIPLDIPRRPDSYYKEKGWINWGDWFGTGRGKKDYFDFKSAKELAQKLGVKSKNEWFTNYSSGKITSELPKYPDQIYEKNGWTNWGDFLGTGRIADHLKEYLPFEIARSYVQKQKLQNAKEWKSFCNSVDFPPNIPKTPHNTYKNSGWKGMHDWLGTNEKSRFYKDRGILSFDEARDFVRSQKLLNWTEWRLFTKSENIPNNVPKNPEKIYKNSGWINWGDWLGTSKISNHKRSFLSFEEAKVEVKKLNFKSSTGWREFVSKNPDLKLPALPYKVYKNSGWKSWGDFLGTGNVALKDKKFLEFEEMRAFVLNLGLKNELEWRAWKRVNDLPNNIPGNPDRIYKDKGWKGWAYFFGR